MHAKSKGFHKIQGVSWRKSRVFLFTKSRFQIPGSRLSETGFITVSTGQRVFHLRKLLPSVARAYTGRVSFACLLHPSDARNNNIRHKHQLHTSARFTTSIRHVPFQIYMAIFNRIIRCLRLFRRVCMSRSLHAPFLHIR